MTSAVEAPMLDDDPRAGVCRLESHLDLGLVSVAEREARARFPHQDTADLDRFRVGIGGHCQHSTPDASLEPHRLARPPPCRNLFGEHLEGRGRVDGDLDDRRRDIAVL